MKDYLCVILGVLITVVMMRGYLNTRERQRERRRLRHKAHYGVRNFCGQDWTLPKWERHESAAVKYRGRTTNGGVLLDALAALVCSYLLLGVLWFMTTLVFGI